MDKMKNGTLPEEVWLRVFTFMEPMDLAGAARVCRLWSQLIGQSETLWKAQCLSVSNSETKQQILADKRSGYRRWKDIYVNNYGHLLTKRQWFDGKFSYVQKMEQLPAKVFCPMDKDTWGEIFEWELKR